ncbi:hypothetical protein BGZ94_007660 [Podila epigama]|nr:hypothetical protein BGZ94_007660 [Podila epigama]
MSYSCESQSQESAVYQIFLPICPPTCSCTSAVSQMLSPTYVYPVNPQRTEKTSCSHCGKEPTSSPSLGISAGAARDAKTGPPSMATVRVRLCQKAVSAPIIVRYEDVKSESEHTCLVLERR